MKAIETYSRVWDNRETPAVLLVAVTVVLLLVCVASADGVVMLVAAGLLLLLCVAAFMLRKAQRRALACMRVEEGVDEAMRSRFLHRIPDEETPHAATEGASQKGEAGDAPLPTLMSDLTKAGLYPALEDDVVTFRYQGGYFQVSQTGENMIRVVFPRIYSVSVARQDFLCRLLNRINTTYAICKLVAVPSEVDMLVEVHGFADIFYKDCFADRLSLLRDIFAVFFDQQRNLAIGMAINEAEELVLGESSEGDCASAYKDISLN